MQRSRKIFDLEYWVSMFLYKSIELWENINNSVHPLSEGCIMKDLYMKFKDMPGVDVYKLSKIVIRLP